jgi:hypothetical protein
MDRNKVDDAWSGYRFDLTQYAGRTVTLTFEVDPGPRDSSSFDYAYWGDREIACSGPAPAGKHGLFPSAKSSLDGPVRGWGSASPTHSAKIDHDSLITTFVGTNPKTLFDALDFRATLDGKTKSIPFANFASFDLVKQNGSIISSDSPEVRQDIAQKPNDRGTVTRTATFTIDDRKIVVTEDIDDYDGSSVRLRLRSNDPYIAAVHVGRIGPTAYVRNVLVPYYGSVAYLPDTGLFANVVIDYGLSHATRLDAETATYEPLTDSSRLRIDETIYYALSPQVDDVLATPIGSQSPYRKTMGDSVVLDYWSGDAPDLAASLQKLNTYGLNRFLTIVHDWQHGGYDQQLPAVLPANSYIGGNAGIIQLTKTAKSLAERVALHENYVDFYPNGPLYNPADIAVSPDGKFLPAWMWPGHISYVMTPVEMHKYAAEITPKVHEELGTNACYLDVHSAITPFVHTDARAGRPGAGEFITMLNAQKSLWQYMRDVHGGPVLGEGNNHWYWSGLLDGVEAQFGTGIPQTQAETAPLFVDFDLLKIHPRQINHGMGYLERWLASGEQDKATQSQLDDYRMEEIAFGHSAFIANSPETMDLPFMWEESNLVVPVASRYAEARVRDIFYAVGYSMLGADSAIEAGTKFDRVKIDYDNGLTIWANSSYDVWSIRSNGRNFALPKYGWLAVSKDLLAYTARIDGMEVTFARTPASIYANARTSLYFNADANYYAVPTATELLRTGNRQYQFDLNFDTRKAIPAGYVPFVHLVSSTGDIVTQYGSGIPSAPDTWTVGRATSGDIVEANIPENLPDGNYEIRVGLYSPANGDRLALDGADDGQLRYRVAEVDVSNNGAQIKLTPITALPPAYPSASHMVDFGVIATNGSIKMVREAPGTWKVTPLPRDREFEVQLIGKSIDGGFKRIEAQAIDAEGNSSGKPFKLIEIRGTSELPINLPVGAVAYRLTEAR